MAEQILTQKEIDALLDPLRGGNPAAEPARTEEEPCEIPHFVGAEAIIADKKASRMRIGADLSGLVYGLEGLATQTGPAYLEALMEATIELFARDPIFYGNPFRRQYFMEMVGERLNQQAPEYQAFTVALLLLRRHFDHRAEVGFTPGERPEDAWFAYDPEDIRAALKSTRIQILLKEKPLTAGVFAEWERHVNDMPSAKGQVLPEGMDPQSASAESLSAWVFSRLNINVRVGTLESFQDMMGAFYRRVRILDDTLGTNLNIRHEAVAAILGRIDARGDLAIEARKFVINGLGKGNFPKHDFIPKQDQVDWGVFAAEARPEISETPSRLAALVALDRDEAGEEHIQACVNWLFEGMDTFEPEGGGAAHKKMILNFLARLSCLTKAIKEKGDAALWNPSYRQKLGQEVVRKIDRRTIIGQALKFIVARDIARGSEAKGRVDEILEENDNYQDQEVDWDIFSEKSDKRPMPTKILVPTSTPDEIFKWIFSHLSVYSFGQKPEAYKAMVDLFRLRVSSLDLSGLSEADRGELVEKLIAQIKNTTPLSQALRNWVRHVLTGEAAPKMALLERIENYSLELFEKDLFKGHRRGRPRVVLPKEIANSPSRLADFIMDGLDLYQTEATPAAYQAMVDLFIARVKEVNDYLNSQIAQEQEEYGPGDTMHLDGTSLSELGPDGPGDTLEMPDLDHHTVALLNSPMDVKRLAWGELRYRINNSNVLGQSMRAYLLSLTRSEERVVEERAGDEGLGFTDENLDRAMADVRSGGDLNPDDDVAALALMMGQVAREDGGQTTRPMPRTSSQIEDCLAKVSSWPRANNNMRDLPTEMPHTEIPSNLFADTVSPETGTRLLLTDTKALIGWLFSDLDLYLAERINSQAFKPAILLFTARVRALVTEVSKQPQTEDWSARLATIFESIPRTSLSSLREYLQISFSPDQARASASDGPREEDVGDMEIEDLDHQATDAAETIGSALRDELSGCVPDWDFIIQGQRRYPSLTASDKVDQTAASELLYDLVASLEPLEGLDEYLPKFFSTLTNLFNEQWLKGAAPEEVHTVRAEILALFDRSPIQATATQAINAYFANRWEVYCEKSAEAIDRATSRLLVKDAFILNVSPAELSEAEIYIFEKIDRDMPAPAEHMWKQIALISQVTERIQEKTAEMEERGYRNRSKDALYEAIGNHIHGDSELADLLRRYATATVYKTGDQETVLNRIQTLMLSPNTQVESSVWSGDLVSQGAFDRLSPEDQRQVDQITRSVDLAVPFTKAKINRRDLNNFFIKLENIGDERLSPRLSTAVLHGLAAMIQDTELGRQLKWVISDLLSDPERYLAAKEAFLARLDQEKPLLPQMFTSFEGEYDHVLASEGSFGAYVEARKLCQAPEGGKVLGERGDFLAMIKSFGQGVQKVSTSKDPLFKDACVDCVKGETPLAQELRLYIAEAFAGRKTDGNFKRIQEILRSERLEVDWGILGEQKLIGNIFPEGHYVDEKVACLAIRENVIKLKANGTLSTWSAERRAYFAHIVTGSITDESELAQAAKATVEAILTGKGIDEAQNRLDAVIVEAPKVPPMPSYKTARTFRFMLGEFFDQLDSERETAKRISDAQYEKLVKNFADQILGTSEFAKFLREAFIPLFLMAKTEEGRSRMQHALHEKIEALGDDSSRLPWEIFSPKELKIAQAEDRAAALADIAVADINAEEAATEACKKFFTAIENAKADFEISGLSSTDLAAYQTHFGSALRAKLKAKGPLCKEAKLAINAAVFMPEKYEAYKKELDRILGENSELTAADLFVFESAEPERSEVRLLDSLKASIAAILENADGHDIIRVLRDFLDIARAYSAPDDTVVDRAECKEALLSRVVGQDLAWGSYVRTFINELFDNRSAHSERLIDSTINQAAASAAGVEFAEIFTGEESSYHDLFEGLGERDLTAPDDSPAFGANFGLEDTVAATPIAGPKEVDHSLPFAAEEADDLGDPASMSDEVLSSVEEVLAKIDEPVSAESGRNVDLTALVNSMIPEAHDYQALGDFEEFSRMVQAFMGNVVNQAQRMQREGWSQEFRDRLATRVWARIPKSTGRENFIRLTLARYAHDLLKGDSRFRIAHRHLREELEAASSSSIHWDIFEPAGKDQRPETIHIDTDPPQATPISPLQTAAMTMLDLSIIQKAKGMLEIEAREMAANKPMLSAIIAAAAKVDLKKPKEIAGAIIASIPKQAPAIQALTAFYSAIDELIPLEIFEVKDNWGAGGYLPNCYAEIAVLIRREGNPAFSSLIEYIGRYFTEEVSDNLSLNRDLVHLERKIEEALAEHPHLTAEDVFNYANMAVAAPSAPSSVPAKREDAVARGQRLWGGNFHAMAVAESARTDSHRDALGALDSEGETMDPSALAPAVVDTWGVIDVDGETIDPGALVPAVAPAKELEDPFAAPVEASLDDQEAQDEADAIRAFIANDQEATGDSLFPALTRRLKETSNVSEQIAPLLAEVARIRGIAMHVPNKKQQRKMLADAVDGLLTGVSEIYLRNQTPFTSSALSIAIDQYIDINSPCASKFIGIMSRIFRPAANKKPRFGSSAYESGKAELFRMIKREGEWGMFKLEG